MKTIGVIPARMAASRLPGKPLFPILGMPMIEHVYNRARMFEGWDELVLATCDREIEEFAKAKGYPVVMIGSHHTRALVMPFRQYIALYPQKKRGRMDRGRCTDDRAWPEPGNEGNRT